MNAKELLHVADAISKEKSIEKDIIFEALESAMGKAAKVRYGYENDIKVFIDRSNGSIKMQRCREVISDDELAITGAQINLTQALDEKSDAEVGEFLLDDLPQVEFGRVAVQTVRQAIQQRIREAECQRQYDDFKDLSGTIITGVVKRIEFGNVIVDLGKAEGYLKRDELISREKMRIGDRVKCLILEVERSNTGPQVYLSRSHHNFVRELFKQEVPEIEQNVIEIMKVVRDSGSKSKVLVNTDDRTVDPVGACVGMRGVRIQSIINELQGEKIDVIVYSDDKEELIYNAVVPAKPEKIIIYEDEKRAEVVVEKDKLSIAIGRRGQNVRLASAIVGMHIDMLTDEEARTRRADIFKKRSELFIAALDLDDIIGQLLALEGFVDVSDVANASVGELTSIEGFDEDVAAELIQRAKNYLAKKSAGREKKSISQSDSDDSPESASNSESGDEDLNASDEPEDSKVDTADAASGDDIETPESPSQSDSDDSSESASNSESGDEDLNASDEAEDSKVDTADAASGDDIETPESAEPTTDKD